MNKVRIRKLFDGILLKDYWKNKRILYFKSGENFIPIKSIEYLTVATRDIWHYDKANSIGSGSNLTRCFGIVLYTEKRIITDRDYFIYYSDDVLIDKSEVPSSINDYEDAAEWIHQNEMKTLYGLE